MNLIPTDQSKLPAILRKDAEFMKTLTETNEALMKFRETVELIDSKIVRVAGRTFIHASVGFVNLLIRWAGKKAVEEEETKAEECPACTRGEFPHRNCILR